MCVYLSITMHNPHSSHSWKYKIHSPLVRLKNQLDISHHSPYSFLIPLHKVLLNYTTSFSISVYTHYKKEYPYLESILFKTMFSSPNPILVFTNWLVHQLFCLYRIIFKQPDWLQLLSQLFTIGVTVGFEILYVKTTNPNKNSYTQPELYPPSSPLLNQLFVS